MQGEKNQFVLNYAVISTIKASPLLLIQFEHQRELDYSN